MCVDISLAGTDVIHCGIEYLLSRITDDFKCTPANLYQ